VIAENILSPVDLLYAIVDRWRRQMQLLWRRRLDEGGRGRDRRCSRGGVMTAGGNRRLVALGDCLTPLFIA